MLLGREILKVFFRSTAPAGAAKTARKRRQSKKCSECGRTKAWTDYYLYKGRPANKCKACQCKQQRKRYWKNPEKYRAALRARRDLNRESYNTYMRDYYHRKKEGKS